MRTLGLTVCTALGLWAASAAGLRWTPPAGWKDEGSKPMRAASYSVAAAAGDREGGDCAVFFFGAGQGGDIDANIQRWKGQFRQPGGKPVEAQVRKRTVHGLPVTTVETSGEYLGMGGPMAAKAGAKAGYRMLGAIVEGPGGNVFVKFVGPAGTVAANQQKFEQLLASFEKSR